jgi:hypothetical protein
VATSDVKNQVTGDPQKQTNADGSVNQTTTGNGHTTTITNADILKAYCRLDLWNRSMLLKELISPIPDPPYMAETHIRRAILAGVRMHERVTPHEVRMECLPLCDDFEQLLQWVEKAARRIHDEGHVQVEENDDGMFITR